MKTKSFLLIIIGFIFINLTAKAQVNPTEKNYTQLQNTMTNQVQSDYNLVGFEGRAIQKTKDLADYLEIISNKEYDMSLREHTASLALKLFFNDSVKIDNHDKQISELKILKLEDYVHNYLNSEYTKITVEISNFSYSENLRSRKTNDYSGRLEFDQTNKYFNDKTLSEETTEHKEVEIILLKTVKDFGKNRKDVWSVLLGDIKIVK